MASQHMFFIDRDEFDYIRTLFGSAVDGQYIILNESDGFADIVQYSGRYDTVKVITVCSDRLNRAKELKMK